MPVPAVMTFGMPTVSSGIADRHGGQELRVEDHLLGMRLRDGDDAARPTSEPVPAVVGTAMIGAMPSALARVHQSPTSSKSQTGRD